MDVRSLGDRHHHDEQVLDHYETEYYSEQVQDGSDAAAALKGGLSEGEDERATRSATYEVLFGGEDGQTWTVNPQDEASFAAYGVGSPHVLRFDRGEMTVDPAPAK